MKKQGISLLRVLACVGVFTVHFGQRLSLEGKLRDFTDCGKYGVQLFFLISGFLACLSWYKESHKDISFFRKIKNYYITRCVRLLPLYYLCVLYYFISETFFWRDIPNDPYGLYWMRYIVPLNGIVPEDSYFWSNLGTTWTIPVFLTFYFIFPFVTKIIKSFYSSVIVYVVSIVLGFFINRYCHGFFSALTFMHYFILGIVVYFASKENKVKNLLLLCSLIGLSLRFNFIDPRYGVSAILAILLYSLYDTNIINTGINKSIGIIDEYSYTIYLVHGIIFCGIIDKIDCNRLIIAAIAVFGTIVLSIVVHNLYERPINRFLNKIISNK